MLIIFKFAPLQPQDTSNYIWEIFSIEVFVEGRYYFRKFHEGIHVYLNSRKKVLKYQNVTEMFLVGFV